MLGEHWAKSSDRAGLAVGTAQEQGTPRGLGTVAVPQPEQLEAEILPQISHRCGKTSHRLCLLPVLLFAMATPRAAVPFPGLGTLKADSAGAAGGSSASWPGAPE